MASVSINSDQRQILAMFARGRDEEFIAQALELPLKLVNDTVTVLADCDEERARQLVAAYDATAPKLPEREPPAPAPKPKPQPEDKAPCTKSTSAAAPTTPTTTSAAGAAAPAPVTTPGSASAASTWAPPPSPPSPTRSILERAATSESARTRALAGKAHQLLAEIHARVEAEEAERLEKAAKAQERADAEKRVAELQQLLADAQSKLRDLAGRRAASPTSAAAAAPPERDHEPAVVRAWAAENGVECSPNGRVPRVVVDAWRAATGAH